VSSAEEQAAAAVAAQRVKPRRSVVCFMGCIPSSNDDAGDGDDDPRSRANAHIMG
jgi:hypothetical protein